MPKDTYVAAVVGCMVADCMRNAPHQNPICLHHWNHLPAFVRDYVNFSRQKGEEKLTRALEWAVNYLEMELPEGT